MAPFSLLYHRLPLRLPTKKWSSCSTKPVTTMTIVQYTDDSIKWARDSLFEGFKQWLWVVAHLLNLLDNSFCVTSFTEGCAELFFRITSFSRHAYSKLMLSGKFRGENFHEWSKIHEIRESFLPAIRYLLLPRGHTLQLSLVIQTLQEI